MEVINFHCFKCHKDYPIKNEQLNHMIYCKERVSLNKDGGAMACGKLSGGECEFKNKENENRPIKSTRT